MKRNRKMLYAGVEEDLSLKAIFGFALIMLCVVFGFMTALYNF